MTDHWGRNIDYMRVSLTDRCNLRCRYCMPNGVELCGHEDMLSYEELLRVCRTAVDLGITKFKVTGGEPLVRRDCPSFISRLKALPGVEQVTLTTNGILLPRYLDQLEEAGVDAINVSLDALDPELYNQITGCSINGVETILTTLADCVQRGIRTKVNAVLLPETAGEVTRLASIAAELPVDVRFIELMPIGEGAAHPGTSMEQALSLLREVWPDLHPTSERRGNGPARYYASDALQGRIGMIAAISHTFCDTCNRVRLTSTGILKPCLCYEDGTDLGRLLRDGCSDEELSAAMANAISRKPKAHCFLDQEKITEHRSMSQIGG